MTRNEAIDECMDNDPDFLGHWVTMQKLNEYYGTGKHGGIPDSLKPLLDECNQYCENAITNTLEEAAWFDNRDRTDAHNASVLRNQG
jgi:hypothetical protein